MSVTQVSRNTRSLAATSGSVDLGATPTAGNMLIFTATAYDTSSNTIGISGNPAGFVGPFFQRNTSGTTRGIAALYYKVSDGTETSCSITFTGSPTAIALCVEEWSGLDSSASPVDVTMPGAVLAGNGALSSGSASTSNADDFLYGLLGGQSASGITFTWGSGFTANGDFAASSGRHATGTQTVSATGSYAATCTVNQTLTGGFICVAFKQSGDATVALPAASLDIAAPTPSVAGGSSATVALPVVNLTLAAPVPGLAAGATVALPVAGLMLAAPVPVVGGGVGDATVALPVVNLTLAALAPVLTADVEIGLPAAHLNLAAYAPSFPDGTVTPLGWVETVLYDRDGLTRLGSFTSRNVTWQHELSRPGSATFEVPLDDPLIDEFTPRRIVKFTWWRGGAAVARFACRLTSEACDLAVDGRAWLKFETQPGLLAMIGDAVVFPEYGLDVHSSSDRYFGFMSADGQWRLDGNWVLPQGYPMSDETGHRRGHPSGLLAYDPDWIAYINPAAHVSAKTVNYYRATIPCDAGTDIEIDWTCDNFGTLYVDGEALFSPDYNDAGQWMHTVGIKLRTQRDNPLLAVKVENAPLAHSAGWNPMGLVAVVFDIDNEGKRASTLLQSDETNWRVHDNTPEPGWFRAQVLYQLVTEAKDRNVDGCVKLALGFTLTRGSDGQLWTDTSDRGEFIFGVATVPLTDVVEQLTESDFDVDVDTEAMTLHAWARKGSASPTAELAVGVNLTQHAVSTLYAQFTSVLTQRLDGSWLNLQDTAGVADIGVVEAGLSLGSTTQERTAIAVMQTQMRASAQPQNTFTSQTSTLASPIPYVDFQLGDAVTVPGPRGAGTVTARALAFTVDATGDVVRAWVEQLGEVA